MKTPKKTNTICDVHDYSIMTDTREIFLHGNPHNDDGMDTDYRSAATFLKNLRYLDSISSSPIVVHQNNSGGDWYSGMLMYDAIAFCNSPIIFLCYGMAGSMGSIIPQAVYPNGFRLSMPNCDWLIHEGYNSFDGTQRQTFSYSLYSEELRKKIYDIYARSCQTGEYFKDYSQSKIKSYIKRKIESKEDWWISSEEALYYGFCDGIYGSENFKDLAMIKGQL